MTMRSIDTEAAVERLMRFLAVEGITGEEEAIGLEIAEALAEIGVAREAMHFDDAHHRIPHPTQNGNLIVDIDGDLELGRRLFLTHRDTVAVCAGAVPRRDGDRIVPEGPTGLGGDDRAGVACLVTLVAELKRQGLPHPPLTLLFTVREESGMWGARCIDPARLQGYEYAFNVDGASPSNFYIGAVGGAIWEAEVVGRAAHAGLAPEKGISATLVVAEALTAARRAGWWGAVEQDGHRGTSNAGPLTGRDGGGVGSASNVVTDYACIEGEARSHDPEFIPRIVDGYRAAFEHAVEATRNVDGNAAQVEFRSSLEYAPFRMDPESPLVRFAVERARSIGQEPELAVGNGGLDANWIAQHGVPALTFGIGQRAIHTTDEWLDIPEYLDGCRLAVALASAS